MLEGYAEYHSGNGGEILKHYYYNKCKFSVQTWPGETTPNLQLNQLSPNLPFRSPTATTASLVKTFMWKKPRNEYSWGAWLGGRGGRGGVIGIGLVLRLHLKRAIRWTWAPCSVHKGQCVDRHMSPNYVFGRLLFPFRRCHAPCYLLFPSANLIV